MDSPTISVTPPKNGISIDHPYTTTIPTSRRTPVASTHGGPVNPPTPYQTPSPPKTGRSTYCYRYRSIPAMVRHDIDVAEQLLSQLKPPNGSHCTVADGISKAFVQMCTATGEVFIALDDKGTEVVWGGGSNDIIY